MKKLSAGWWTDKYIYAMLAVFPLFVGFWGYTETTASKFVFFGVLTVLWLVFAGIALLKSREGELGKPEGRIVFPLATYLLLCLISAACSPYGASVLLGEGRFDGLLTTLLCVMAFCGGAFSARAKRGYLFAAMGAGALCCLVGIFQLFGLNPLGFFPAGYDYYDAGVKYTGSFFGTIGNADLTSAYLCLLLPIGTAYYIMSKKRELWLLPILAVMAFSLLTCRVAAGLLSCACLALLMPPLLIANRERLHRALECGALMALGLCAALCFHGEKTGGELHLWLAFSVKAAVMLILAVFAGIARLVFARSEFSARGLRIFFVCLSAAAFIGALAGVYFFAPESGTLWELSQVLHGHLEDSFGSSRILIWRRVLEIIPQRPLLGGGPGTLALRIDVNFSRFVEETGNTLTAFIDNAHNEYLGTLANTGLLSLLCYAAAQIVSVVLAIKRGGCAALCLICALVCYWISGFFGLGLFLVSPLMWICWGLLAAELCKPKTKDAE